MKRVLYSDRFQKQYKRLPTNVKKKFNRQLGLLLGDYRHPSLGSKKMTNQGDIWEARIDKQYRITFQIKDDFIFLRKVGTHEIYRKP